MTKNTRILINNETEYERATNTLVIIHKVNNCRPQNNRLHFKQKKSIFSNENDFLICRNNKHGHNNTMIDRIRKKIVQHVSASI